MFKIVKSSVVYLNADRYLVNFSHNDADENLLSEHVSDMDETVQEGDYGSIRIQNALEESDRIHRQALLEAEHVKRAAWQEGYDEGKRDGERSLALAREQQNAQFKRVLKELDAIKERIQKETEENILQLSIEIARKLVNLEIKTNDSIIIDLVKNAVSRLFNEGRYTIRLSKSEYERFSQMGMDKLQAVLQSNMFQLVEDSSLDKGGCILENESGVVNVGIDTQLGMIAQMLHAVPHSS